MSVFWVEGAVPWRTEDLPRSDRGKGWGVSWWGLDGGRKEGWRTSPFFAGEFGFFPHVVEIACQHFEIFVWCASGAFLERKHSVRLWGRKIGSSWQADSWYGAGRGRAFTCLRSHRGGRPLPPSCYIPVGIVLCNGPEGRRFGMESLALELWSSERMLW